MVDNFSNLNNKTIAESCSSRLKAFYFGAVLCYIYWIFHLRGCAATPISLQIHTRNRRSKKERTAAKHNNLQCIICIEGHYVLHGQP